MLRAYRSDDLRAAEAPLLAAGVPLMEQASWALAQEVIRRRRSGGAALRGTRVLALVGSGNNGGDALFAAALLARRGMLVHALVCGVPHARGAVAAERAGVTLQRGLRFRNATDGLIALKAGYPSVMLGSTNQYKLPSNYHWPTDVADNVDFACVGDAVLTCAETVRMLAPPAS